MFKEVTDFLDSMIKLGVPSVDCIVYSKGELVYRYINGYSNLEEKTPLKGNEFYNIYSCTKILTCVAALQLFEKGKFNLDDKLSDYMPEFKIMNVKDKDGNIRRAKNDITIRHLFAMTAGFNYDCESDSIKEGIIKTNGECPTREMMKYIAKEPLEFEPGEGFMYSLCHDVLAGFIETLTNMTFGEYLQEHIFKPSKMTETYFNLPPEYMGRMAQQYRYNDINNTITNTGTALIRYRLGAKYESGGAGLISTTEDYIKFLEALRKGLLLKRDTIELMKTDMLTEEVYNNYFKMPIHLLGYSWGLGVRCPKAGSENVDFGWGGAAGSFYMIDMENDITCFYVQHLMNSVFNTDDTDYAKPKLARMLARICGKEKE